METLRSSTKEVLQEVMGPNPQEIIYLDTPRHRNLGDSLIWLGSKQYLNDLGHRVVYHADMGRFRDDDLKKTSDSAVIVLQGGGNFGDLYPLHDEFRRYIVQQYPQRRIIMMPQSIYYSSTASLRQAIRDYRVGNRLTILLRESRSMDIANEEMPDMDVRFCYDSALGALLPERTVPARDEVLTLARTDAEAIGDSKAVRGNSVDWSWGRMNGLSWKTHIAVGAAFKRLPTLVQNAMLPVSQYANQRLLDINIKAALQQFEGSPVVATNRLHAHILSSLLGIPHIVMDNSYGKVSGIYNEYSGGFSTAYWANDWIEALNAADSILSRKQIGTRES
ncbi:polysaccharide pyruvyl transferase family protein [Kocuria arenosa]|uniref:polysaccharide pyruvyl transferase family protein n=1 Tax=Kocuria arenosa TaxID=3071446 RepID=UPI0034D76FAE